jgi:hypothetical protein
MPRKRDETLVQKARVLASQGKTQTEVSAALGVPRRTLRSWPVEWVTGRPRVSDGQASARTRRRRRLAEAGKTQGGPPDVHPAAALFRPIEP